MDDYPPSLLDRLTDPDLPRDRCRYTLRRFEATVLRDLEDLLNTRRPTDGTFEGADAVAKSIANYGLQDVTHRDGSSAVEREQFAQHIRDVIAVFEPRLTNLEVMARDPEEIAAAEGPKFRAGAMYFRIRATLNVEPEPIDGVTFESVLDLVNGKHAVTLPA